ncbi:hypothetical protein VTK73DRAFT_6657 [Phialemonium thermophilum]|uniref:Ig-like domain-containing protein n=1 Tax=Phialemonium thermophilum TaxID=223376 RepID=A0ABR3WJB4_9PEZI
MMAFLVTLLAVCAAGLVAAAPRTAVATRASASSCTSDSFRIPSWFVQDFHAAGGNATFHVVNRVTNTSSEVGCRGSLTGSKATCSVRSAGNATSPDVTLYQNGTAALLAVRDVWSCRDRNATGTITFVASGNASLPLRCSHDGRSSVCNATDPVLLVKGSLQSPVAITPQYATGPLGHDAPGCSARSESPSWTLRGVYYLNQTGDGGATSLPAQNFMLQIVNPLLGYQAGCVGFLADDLAPTPVTLSCSGGADFSGRNRYQIDTTVYFQPATFSFTVNQTYYCDDVDPARPVRILATGTENLPLHCTTVLTPASDPSAPPANSTSCYADAITIDGTLVSRTPLPPYSIEDPLPTPDGCTVTSLVDPAWRLSNFEVDRNASATEPGARGSLGFSLALDAPGDQFGFPADVVLSDVVLVPSSNAAQGGNGTSAAAATSGDEGWYPCVFGQGQEPLVPHSCSFRYDGGTGRFALRAEWICNDLDPDHPIYARISDPPRVLTTPTWGFGSVVFDGVATTTVPELNCSTVRGTADLTRCQTDRAFSWVAPITNVTWHQGDASSI